MEGEDRRHRHFLSAGKDVLRGAAAFEISSPGLKSSRLRRSHIGGRSQLSINDPSSYENSASGNHGDFRTKSRKEHNYHARRSGGPTFLSRTNMYLKKNLIEAIGKMVMATNSPNEYKQYIKSNPSSVCSSEHEISDNLQNKNYRRPNKTNEQSAVDLDIDILGALHERKGQILSKSSNSPALPDESNKFKHKQCSRGDIQNVLKNLKSKYISKEYNKFKVNKTDEKDHIQPATTRKLRRNATQVGQNSHVHSARESHAMSVSGRRRHRQSPFNFTVDTISNASANSSVHKRIIKTFRAEVITLLKTFKVIKNGVVRKAMRDIRHFQRQNNEYEMVSQWKTPEYKGSRSADLDISNGLLRRKYRQKTQLPATIVEQEGQEESRKQSLVVRPENVGQVVGCLEMNDGQDIKPLTIEVPASDSRNISHPILTKLAMRVLHRADKHYHKELRRALYTFRRCNDQSTIHAINHAAKKIVVLNLILGPRKHKADWQDA